LKNFFHFFNNPTFERSKVKLLSIRGTAFEAVKLNSSSAAAEVANIGGDYPKNELSSFTGQQLAKSDRPSLTAAKVVVSG
jgi:electron transfer flavoprotein alpha subunit